MVPEEFALPQVTLDTYVKMNKGFYPHFSEEVLERCLADFELSRQTKLHQLSMGQKKKAFMSFALATGTRLLLMDEPTNGLDIPSKSQFRKVIANNMTDDRMIMEFLEQRNAEGARTAMRLHILHAIQELE